MQQNEKEQLKKNFNYFHLFQFGLWFNSLYILFFVLHESEQDLANNVNFSDEM